MVRVFLLGNTKKVDGRHVRDLRMERGKVVKGEPAEVWLNETRMVPGVVSWTDDFGFRFDVELANE